jgi:hypothetical protein
MSLEQTKKTLPLSALGSLSVWKTDDDNPLTVLKKPWRWRAAPNTRSLASA